MKRSEMLSKIASVIINYNEVDSIIKRDKALEMAETILQVQEEDGMFYCPVEDLGDFGQLRTPKGWEGE